jgi:dynein heavy chain
LKELESGLLYKLANAKGDILEDIALIESLEYSKKLSLEINEKVEIGKITDENINVASEFYRPAASRGALVFFMMCDLCKMHSFYKFSLDSFVIVVKRAIDIVAAADKAKKAAAAGGDAPEGEDGEAEKAEGEGEAEKADGDAEKAEGEGEEKGEEEIAQIEEMTPKTLAKRVEDLTESITYQAFNYTRRGTFE